jgi:hypothetical protein
VKKNYQRKAHKSNHKFEVTVTVASTACAHKFSPFRLANAVRHGHLRGDNNTESRIRDECCHARGAAFRFSSPAKLQATQGSS